jgi:hypothetical protein
VLRETNPIADKSGLLDLKHAARYCSGFNILGRSHLDHLPNTEFSPSVASTPVSDAVWLVYVYVDEAGIRSNSLIVAPKGGETLPPGRKQTDVGPPSFVNFPSFSGGYCHSLRSGAVQVEREEAMPGRNRMRGTDWPGP